MSNFNQFQKYFSTDIITSVKPEPVLRCRARGWLPRVVIEAERRAVCRELHLLVLG